MARSASSSPAAAASGRDAGRRREVKQRGSELHVAFDTREEQRRGLAEVIGKLHRFEVVAGKTELQFFKAAVAALGQRLEPFEPVVLAGFAQLADGGRAADVRAMAGDC